ncbi:MAG TPA: sugar transferase [Elusimicrobiota bacterium]|nr:sugar transferase [Elusimicrobiota bacterium]
MALKAPRPRRARRPGVPAPAAGLPPWLRHALRTALHLLFDAAAVTAAYRAAFWARFEWPAFLARVPLSGVAVTWSSYEGLLYAAVPIWLVILHLNKLYTASWLSAADRFVQIFKACALGTGTILVAAFLYERLAYSRLMLAGVFPLALLFVCASQALALAIDDWLARHETAKPVLLVGGGPIAEILRERIHDRHPEAEIRELAALPPAEELDRILGEREFYELILLRTKDARERVLAAAEACDSRGVSFKMVPDMLEIRMGEVQMDHHLGLPAYRIKHASLTRANFLAKRALDAVFASALLLVTAPFWLVICLLVKLDSRGPILFTGERYGFRGRVFHAYKFRTMVADAEKRIGDVKGLNDTKGAFFKAKNDPRVTRVGKYLRRFSLDEFPQFLNVLRGEMSVVGPRPLALTTGELEALERDFGETSKKRANLLPGITGLWQVSGRSDVSSEQRFALDLYYIEHWSLGMDLEIILKTPYVMVFGTGAY